jgi:hypothetical protein
MQRSYNRTSPAPSRLPATGTKLFWSPGVVATAPRHRGSGTLCGQFAPRQRNMAGPADPAGLGPL